MKYTASEHQPFRWDPKDEINFRDSKFTFPNKACIPNKVAVFDDIQPPKHKDTGSSSTDIPGWDGNQIIQDPK